MPLKTCPSCQKECGPRTKVCPDCKHAFSTNGKKPTASASVVGMGLWARDDTKGLPKIEPPGPLPSTKLSLDDVKDYIVYEGLGFCVFEYIAASKIQDAKLAKLWKSANKALLAIQEYLYENNVSSRQSGTTEEDTES